MKHVCFFFSFLLLLLLLLLLLSSATSLCMEKPAAAATAGWRFTGLRCWLAAVTAAAPGPLLLYRLPAPDYLSSPI